MTTVNLSLFAGAGWQFFDNNGVPLAGGLLYTYSAGTTTPIVTYTSNSGSIANPNPIVLDASGRVPNEIWLTPTTTYKFVLQTSSAVQIGSWDNIPGANDIEAFVASLSADTGSSLVGFLQSGTGAITTETVQTKLRQFVNVQDFGAKGDGSTDDTTAFNTALLAIGNAGGGVVYAMAGVTHYIASTILIPKNIILDLQDSTLKGTGNTSSSNTLIKSAVITSGSLVANTSANSLTGMSIRNGNLYNAGQAISLQSCIDACNFQNLTINACYNGIYANFCLYSTFQNIMYRNGASGYGYQFDNNCNAITLKNCYAVGSSGSSEVGTGFLFTNKAYTVNMINCSMESCSTGILTNEIHELKIDGCYFETVGLALNLSDSNRKIGVSVENSFFSNVSIIIQAYTTNNFYWAVNNEIASNCSPGTFSLPTNTSYGGPALNATCTGVIEMIASSVNPTNTGIPSNMNLSDGIELRYIQQASIGGTSQPYSAGTIYAKSIVTTGVQASTSYGIIPFYYYGGTNVNAPTGVVPFCSVSIPTGSSVTGTVQTNIYAAGASIIIFWLYVVDANGSHTFQGRAYGTTLYMDSSLPSGYTVSITSGGYLVVNIAGISNSAGTATISGIVRHI